MVVSSADLLEAAVASGLIDSGTADRLREDHRRDGQLIDAVTSHGRFPRAALYRALAEMRGLLFVDLRTAVLEMELVRRVPERSCASAASCLFLETQIQCWWQRAIRTTAKPSTDCSVFWDAPSSWCWSIPNH